MLCHLLKNLLALPFRGASLHTSPIAETLKSPFYYIYQMRKTQKLFDALGHFGIDPSGAIDNYPDSVLKKIKKAYDKEVRE